VPYSLMCLQTLAAGERGFMPVVQIPGIGILSHDQPLSTT
jgi:hypothetical protein